MGYTIKKSDSYNITSDMKETEFWELYELCRPYTMTSIERMYALFNSVRYILDNKIDGDFVECGVWRGGSSMLIAKMLQNRKINNRKLYLYDTYEGMSDPVYHDYDYRGKQAAELLNTDDKVKCYADINDVKTNISLTNLSHDQIILIKGKVEDTIPSNSPNLISLLRLDTDWYESTYHELKHLYPILNHNGVLIIDDYGHWEGCRKAVTQYFNENNISHLFNRIDYTGRITIKNI